MRSGITMSWLLLQQKTEVMFSRQRLTLQFFGQQKTVKFSFIILQNLHSIVWFAIGSKAHIFHTFTRRAWNRNKNLINIEHDICFDSHKERDI